MIISYTVKAERHIMRAAGIVASKAVKALKRAGYTVAVFPDYMSAQALAACSKGYDAACNALDVWKPEESKAEQVAEREAKAETVDIQAIADFWK